MHSVRVLAASFGLIVYLSDASFAQTSCRAFPVSSSCSTTGRANCDEQATGRESINFARHAEGLGPIVLPPTYGTAPSDQKIIMLINAERRSRGIDALNNEADQNDPLIGYVAYNHSQLLAEIPKLGGMINKDGVSTAHNTAIDGTVGDRLAGIPGHESFGDGAEIVTGERNPERAIWNFMYNDAESNWGHRNGILNCNWKIAGAGVVPTINGNTNYIVDFISNPDNGYKMLSLPPGTPKPARQTTSPVTIGWFRDYHANVRSDQDPLFLKMSFSGQIHEVYGKQNGLKAIYAFPYATWGLNERIGLPSLGTLPAGNGAVKCLPHLHGGVTGTGLPTAIVYDCAVAVFNNGRVLPLEIDVVDLFSQVLRIRSCKVGQKDDPTPGNVPCFQVSSPPPPEVIPRR
jgi:hypothetical protein